MQLLFNSSYDWLIGLGLNIYVFTLVDTMSRLSASFLQDDIADVPILLLPPAQVQSVTFRRHIKVTERRDIAIETSI